jgi:hypothetical protein
MTASAFPPGKCEIGVREGVVWIELRGLIVFQLVLDAMTRGAETARAHNTDRLLFDIRDTIVPEFHATTLESVRRAPDVGLGTALRIALLGAEGDPKLRFIEDVATNRGFQIRAFTDERTALAWANTGRP